MTKEVSPKLILHKPTRKYTLEEYLRKEANSTHKHEFINGEIIKMPNARYNHNLIAMNIAIDLSYQTENSDKNYQILGSDQKFIFQVLMKVSMPMLWQFARNHFFGIMTICF